LKIPGVDYSSGEFEGYLPTIEVEGENHALNYFLNRKYYYTSYVLNYFNQSL
jgi:hypothetical protein